MFMRILPFLSYFYNTTNNTTLTYTDGCVITYNNIPQNETFKYNYDLQYNNLINTQDDISTKNIYYYNNKPVRVNIFKNKHSTIYTYYDNNIKLIKKEVDNTNLNTIDIETHKPLSITHRYCITDYSFLEDIYLKKYINSEEINNDNKICSIFEYKTNINVRILTFHTTNKKIGLDRDIQIHIDENNIATLQDKSLTEDEINKIKQFFNNIPKEQLNNFDPSIAILYYATIMNKEKYKDVSILVPSISTYIENREISQTINLINQIPQDKRKGKYISPCGWLENEHQVNLKIDFDNKIFEIVNTGDYIDDEVINNLQKELNNQFNGENWVVYENHIIVQSTGNCVIASNIESVDMEENTYKINKIDTLQLNLKKLKQDKGKIEQLQLKYDELFKILEQSNKLDSFLQLNSIITTEQEKELNEIEKEKDKIKKQREILKENYCLMEFIRINKLEQKFNNNFIECSINCNESCFKGVLV